jgi:PBP1b-binding outer membrane lipoprotein LpoB
MKKLLSLIILSIFIISCSEKDPVVDETPSEPNGSETVDPSNFGTISPMPSQFLIK